MTKLFGGSKKKMINSLKISFKNKPWGFNKIGHPTKEELTPNNKLC